VPRQKLTREQVIAAIGACAEKLGYVPTVPELMKHAGIDRQEIRKHFGNYKQALEECRLEVPERGRKVEIERLFQDWALVVRTLKRLPTGFEYERLSKYSIRPLKFRFGSWYLVPEGMKIYAEEHGLAEEWRDVLELVGGQPGGQDGGAGMSAGASGMATMADRPVYGPLIRSRALVYGPTNEMGVLCLFGAMAEDLGFLILRIQAGFPDCEAMRVMRDGRLQPVRIEFEYQSHNFVKHMHDPAGCDLIVCWEHNWEDCPLEVIELKRYCQNSLDCQNRRK
jgi:hypothetical protein